jgi:hypothetical protein
MEENRKLNYVKPTVEEVILTISERVAAGACKGSVPDFNECLDPAADAVAYPS